MKKTILVLCVITFIAGSFSLTYGQNAAKQFAEAKSSLNEAQRNVVFAKQDVKQSQKIFNAEYRKFLKESVLQINNNEKSFSEFKVLLSQINLKNKVSYQEKINMLEHKNALLKNKLSSYRKDKNNDKWISFQNKFNRDMDELGIQMWSLN